MHLQLETFLLVDTESLIFTGKFVIQSEINWCGFLFTVRNNSVSLFHYRNK